MKHYTIDFTHLGYEISTVNDNGRTVYLKGLYKCHAIWVTDYLYSKKYKTVDGAASAIKKLFEGSKKS